MKKILLFLVFIFVLSYVDSYEQSETFSLNNGTSGTLSMYPLNWSNASVYNNSWVSYNGIGSGYLSTLYSFGLSSSNYTISVFVNRSGTVGANNQYIFEDGSLFVVCEPDDDLAVYRTTVALVVTLTDFCLNLNNKWSLVSLRYNGTHYDTFLNETLVNSTQATIQTSAGLFNFGGRSGLSREFNGSLDNMRIYNNSLTDSEISSIYNNGLTKNVSVLGTSNDANQVLYYPLSERTGTAIHDFSGGGHTGLTSSTEWSNNGLITYLTRDADYTLENSTITLIKSDYSWWGITANYQDCLVPYDGVSYGNSTYLCPGSYNLNGSTSGMIRLTGSNMFLNCYGATLYGNWTTNGVNPGYFGIYLNNGLRNVTVQNCTIRNIERAFYLRNSTGEIKNNNITDVRMGVHLSTEGFHSGSNISNNIFYNTNYSGLYVTASSLNSTLNFKNNILTDKADGVREDSSSSNARYLVISNNTFTQTLGTRPAIVGFGTDWTITNNRVVGSGNAFSYGIDMRGDNSTITYNNVSNTQYGISTTDAYNITIRFNNIFNNDDPAILRSNLVYFENNTVYNNTNNVDGYNLGINIFNSTNVYIRSNNFTEIATVGVLSQGSYNLTISHNSFDFIPLSNRTLYLSNDGYEPRCAIKLVKYYKGYFGGGFRGVDNATISSNTFDIDTPCYLHLENATNIKHDITNYWYRAFQTPVIFAGKFEFFTPTSFTNYTRYSPIQGLRTDLWNYLGGNTLYMNYSIFSNYLYFNNINITDNMQTNLYNLSNAKITFSNGSTICGTSPGCSGDLNITIPPGNSSYIYYDYYVVSTDTPVTPNSGGGQGFTGDPLNNGVSDKNLCNITYYYLKSHLQTDYTEIDDYKQTYSWTEFRRYLDNWQPYCSDAINRTLKEVEVCDKIFYFLIEKNNKFNLLDIQPLKEEISTKIISVSLGLTNHYARNYKIMCEPINGKRLPSTISSILDISFLDTPVCQPILNKTILGFDLDTSIPFFEINLGEISCVTLDSLKWLVHIESSQDLYSIKGIKIWWFIFPTMIYLLISAFRTNSYLNKSIRKVFGR